MLKSWITKDGENWWLDSTYILYLDYKYIVILSVHFVISKTQYFFEVQPHYNPTKDLKIHVSNVIVIWRWNEKQLWFVSIQWK